MQGGSRGLFKTLGLLLNQYEYQWKETSVVHMSVSQRHSVLFIFSLR